VRGEESNLGERGTSVSGFHANRNNGHSRNGHNGVSRVVIDLRQDEPVVVPPEGSGNGWRVVHYRLGRYERLVKPLLDGMVGGLLLLLAVPLLAIIALTISLSMGRPVLIRQRRVGREGRVFRMFKFRTMDPDRRCEQQAFEEADRRRTHKSPDDPRLTPLGRFLRQWSLDELPQLWHVALGHMSLVGPRPELETIVQLYEPWQHQRHLVKPGLTGIWQVSARGNGNGLMHEHTELDLLYLEQISLLTDLKILVLTVPATLGRERGY